MGMYTWLSEQEFKEHSTTPDEDINEALQEVRSVMPEWYISHRTEQSVSFWGKTTTVVHYTVYHKTRKEDTEVRVQLSATDKRTVLNLLYGLFMGYQKAVQSK